MRNLFIFCSFFFLCAQVMQAQNEPRFYAEASLPGAKQQADQIEVPVGEPVQVSFVLENGKSNGRFSPPDWAAAGFGVLGSSQSSNISIINGQTTASAVYNYTVTPLAEGLLSIPSVSLKNGADDLHSEPISIRALPNPDGVQPELPNRNPAPPAPEPKRSFKTIKM